MAIVDRAKIRKDLGNFFGQFREENVYCLAL
jgi:hypothetical protein